MKAPSQRDVWVVQLDPVAGHEQAGRRPVIVISRDAFNAASYALVDQVRSLDRSRLVERWGRVDLTTHQRIGSLLLRIVAQDR